MGIADDPHLAKPDPDFGPPWQWAAWYRSLGLQIIPCHGKIPLGPWKEFQNTLASQEVFDRWFGEAGTARDANLGAVMGAASGSKIMLDLDIYKQDAGGRSPAATWWQGVLEVHNNGFELETWEQVTGGGGRQLFFQCPEGWMIGNGSTSLNVDVRGQAGFTVLPPSLHASGRLYRWVPGRAPDETPILAAPQWLIDELEALIGAHGKAAAQPEATASPEAEYDAFGHVQDGREKLMRDHVWRGVLELYRRAPIEPTVGEHLTAAQTAYEGYERKVTTRIPGVSKYEGLEREGRGLTAFGRKWAATMRHWGSPKMVAEAAKPDPKSRPDEKDHFEGQHASDPPPPIDEKSPPKLIPLQSAFPINEASLPVRDWVIPGLLLKRNMTLLVAPPASGKSLLTLQLGVTIVTDIEWGGWRSRKPEKVLVINSEDDIIEMQRRLVAVAKEMGVDQTELAGRLMLAETPESIVIAKRDGASKTIVRTPLVEELVATIKHHGIGCVVVDPFAETFEGDENSNSEVKWAGILWREVARRTGCALLLVHHTKKYASGMAGDADASRGGGSMIGIARIVCTFFNMTEDEAVAMDVLVENRGDFVRFDDGKANYSKKGQVRWFEKKTVTLTNATGFAPGDDVGVLVPWKPPGLIDAFGMQDLLATQDAIDRGITDDNGHAIGVPYLADVRAGDRWAGSTITNRLGVDQDKAKAILKLWLDTGVFEVFEYTDPVQRKSRKGIRRTAAKKGEKGDTFG